MGSVRSNRPLKYADSSRGDRKLEGVAMKDLSLLTPYFCQHFAPSFSASSLGPCSGLGLCSGDIFLSADEEV